MCKSADFFAVSATRGAACIRKATDEGLKEDFAWNEGLEEEETEEEEEEEEEAGGLTFCVPSSFSSA